MNHCAHAEKQCKATFTATSPYTTAEHILQHVLPINLGGETCFFGFVVSTKGEIQQQHREVAKKCNKFQVKMSESRYNMGQYYR